MMKENLKEVLGDSEEMRTSKKGKLQQVGGKKRSS